MQQSKSFFVTGIGTEVGKTVVSAILSEALKCAYWKPVQAGDLDQSDSIKIQGWTSNVEVKQEAFRLNQPMSPHAAAELDGVTIQIADLKMPQTQKTTLVEGAGGLMVPFNDKGETWLDWLKGQSLSVVLVSRHYLGSINHTLLTAEVLKANGFQIECLVFVGDENPATESIIETCVDAQHVLRIPNAETVDANFVHAQAAIVAKSSWAQSKA